MAYIPGGPIDAANTVRTIPEGKPLPVGIYSGIITKVDHKPTKNDGVMVEIEFDITAPGEFANRKFWDRFNVVNQNADTVRIAREGLGDLAQACGVAELQDDEQLIGREVMLELYIEEGKPYVDKFGNQKEGRDQNRCGKYWPMGTNVESARKEHKEKQKAKQGATPAPARAGSTVSSPAANKPRWNTGAAAAPAAAQPAAQAAPAPAAAAPAQPAQAATTPAAAAASGTSAPWKRQKQ